MHAGSLLVLCHCPRVQGCDNPSPVDPRRGIECQEREWWSGLFNVQGAWGHGMSCFVCAGP